jgi:hypothetical protein
MYTVSAWCCYGCPGNYCILYINLPTLLHVEKLIANSMRRLVWIHAGHKRTMLVLVWHGSNETVNTRTSYCNFPLKHLCDHLSSVKLRETFTCPCSLFMLIKLLWLIFICTLYYGSRNWMNKNFSLNNFTCTKTWYIGWWNKEFSWKLFIPVLKSCNKFVERIKISSLSFKKCLVLVEPINIVTKQYYLS